MLGWLCEIVRHERWRRIWVAERRRPSEPPARPSQFPRRTSSGSPGAGEQTQDLLPGDPLLINFAFEIAKLEQAARKASEGRVSGAWWSNRCPATPAVSLDASGPVQEAGGRLRRPLSATIPRILQFYTNDTRFTFIIKKHNYMNEVIYYLYVVNDKWSNLKRNVYECMYCF